MYQTKKDSKRPCWEIKEWFIILDQQQEGPFSLIDLKRNLRFTPDTLMWKKGLKEWIPARFIPEVQEIFKDEPESKPLHEPDNEKNLKAKLGQQDQVTIALHQDPFPFILWIIVASIILLYTLYQFFLTR